MEEAAYVIINTNWSRIRQSRSFLGIFVTYIGYMETGSKHEDNETLDVREEPLTEPPVDEIKGCKGEHGAAEEQYRVLCTHAINYTDQFTTQSNSICCI